MPGVGLIRVSCPFDTSAIAARNLGLLKKFPKPGVPLVIVAGKALDGNSDWLAELG